MGETWQKSNVSEPDVTVDLQPISSLLGSSGDTADQRHPGIDFTCLVLSTVKTF